MRIILHAVSSKNLQFPYQKQQFFFTTYSPVVEGPSHAPHLLSQIHSNKNAKHKFKKRKNRQNPSTITLKLMDFVGWKKKTKRIQPTPVLQSPVFQSFPLWHWDLVNLEVKRDPEVRLAKTHQEKHKAKQKKKIIRKKWEKYMFWMIGYGIDDYMMEELGLFRFWYEIWDVKKCGKRPSGEVLQMPFAFHSPVSSSPTVW